MTLRMVKRRWSPVSSFQLLKENVALRICGIYALISSLWILFSDQWLFSFFAERADMALVSMVKGIVFVLVTSAIIYLLINRGVRALKQSAESYRSLIETSPDAIVLVDLDARIIMANRQVLSLYGHDRPEDVIGKTILHFVAPQDRERTAAAVRTLLDTGTFPGHEHVALRKDGTTLPMDLRASLVLNGGQMPKAIIVILRDISERKQAGEALRESELKFRSLAEESPNMIFINKEGRVVYANRKCEELTGYSTEELCDPAFNFFSLIEPDSIALIKENLARHAKGEEIPPYEYTILTKQGGRIEGIHTTKLIKYEGGSAILGIITDITERKRAEKALRDAERNYREIFEYSGEGIYQSTPGGRFITVNPKFANMLGYESPEELIAAVTDIGRQLYVNQEERSAFRRELEEKGSVKGFVSQLYRKDGGTVWVSENARVVRNGSPQIRCYEGALQDITERKQVVEALRESEERYRSLVEMSPDGIVVHSEGRLVFANTAAVELLGAADRESVIGRSIFDFVHQDYHSRVKERIRAMKEGANGSPLIEEKFIRLDGTVVDVEVVAIPFTYNSQPAVQVVIRDITLRNQVEHEMRLLAQTVASTKDCVTITDLKDKILFVNDAFLETYGYRREELSGRNVSIFRSPATPPEIGGQILPATLAGGWYGEIFNRRKDGSDFPVELWTSVVRDQTDEPVAMVGVARDISDRKRAEQALRASEAKFRQLIEQAADGVFAAEKDGRLLLVNPKACEMLGYTESELLDLNIRDTYPTEELSLATLRMRDAQPGQSLRFERNMKRKDGSLFPVEVSLQLLKDGTFQEIVRDVSARKRAEESIHRLYTAIEQSDEVIFMTERDGTITYVNPAFQKIYGFTKEEAVGKTPRILKGSTLTEDDYRDFWTLLLAGKSVRGEIVNRTRSGKFITVETSVNPVLDSGGSITGFIAVQNDITDRKKAGEERKALEAQLFQAQKIESIGTLAGGVAHDFNNILGIILGHATLLDQNSDNPSSFLKSRDAIVSAVQRGASLVQQILTFARKTEVSFEPVNLNDTVVELAKLLEETFPKTITFSLRLAPNASYINADRTQLHQTLLNLCVNARDAMPDGGVLSIGTERIGGIQLQRRFTDAIEDGYVRISVSDSGMGMDEATRVHIFEPFFTTKPIGKGTGLGLAVVHGIMKSHHGFVDVESQPGNGATFSLYFPSSKLNHEAHQSRKITGSEGVGGRETILVVEDEEALCDLVRALLESKGYRVLTAVDGEGAIKLYRAHSEDIALVLSDMGLPRLSGEDVFLQMKAINPDLKIILVSGYLEPEVKARLIKSGAKGFVQKPYVPLEVLERIRETLDEVSS
jgi:two-component system cell cycle sensor histidine kinase/response regulator CckA